MITSSGLSLLDTAEMPLFGANGGGGGGDGGDTAAQRVQEHWAAMRGQEAEHEMRNERMVIRTARRAMFPSLVIALVIVILLVDSSVVMRVWPPPSPVTLLNATTICNSEYEFTAYKLRKEWASQVLASGVPLEAVAEMLGNTIQILLDHYVDTGKHKINLKLG